MASPAYLELNGLPETPRDLARHECLVHGEIDAAALWRFGRERGAEIPVSVRGRVAASSSEAVLIMARRGLGIALLAEWLVADDIREQRLVSLLPGFPAPPAPIYVLTPPSRFMPSAVRALSEHLAATLAPRLAAPWHGGGDDVADAGGREPAGADGGGDVTSRRRRGEPRRG